MMRQTKLGRSKVQTAQELDWVVPSGHVIVVR